MIELMIEALIVIGLCIFGAALGSFAAATVWRLRAAQLAADAARGEKIARTDTLEVEKLTRHKRSVTTDRSVCLHCGHQLRWYELLPVISWVIQGGKCRHCKRPIGSMEILAEVLLGVAFGLSYVLWPYGFSTDQGIVFFVLWLLILTALAIHWMYDARWFLLLDKVTIFLLVVAILFVALKLAGQSSLLLTQSLIGLGLTLVALPGFYGLLYIVSRGAWIGLGDVKLLVPFALMLPSWESGILLIFLANLIGCLVLLPGMLTKKLTRTTRVPFGPFLILAFIVTFLCGQRILDFYFGTILF
ncbi:type IV pilus prepilin peptidase PilD [Candidatus Mycosynbacter amalyticus]|uniref:Type IV pilus prepilin peptidase PilD n=2 Tax=Candidatus Mycosynbacter amalyticus TaxID=2665156 RepID=A0A857MP30_9BACT|nr:type IV pilus prepilin peptidase PilD [Candidatus Mycosynbacter amalyticus]